MANYLGMPESTAFSALAEKLPPKQKAQFLATSLRLKNLPPDDELVVALEALGFTTLILKEIPREIAETVSKMRSGLDDAQREGLQEDIEEVLKRSIDTPSYKDLREMVGEMKDQRGRFNQDTISLMKSLSQTRTWLERSNNVMPSVALGISAGLVAGTVMFAGIFLTKPTVSTEIRGTVLPPSIQRGLNYFEVDLPEFGGNVGLVEVQGEVISAFVDGASGIVVMKAPKKRSAENE